jgi:hypothetical protein
LRRILLSVNNTADGSHKSALSLLFSLLGIKQNFDSTLLLRVYAYIKGSQFEECTVFPNMYDPPEISKRKNSDMNFKNEDPQTLGVIIRTSVVRLT